MTGHQLSHFLKESSREEFANSDLLRGMIETVLQNLLDTEFESFLGAKPHERTQNRTGYRNGSYPRTLTTRIGTIDLKVCRDREGQFQTELFERYQRHERALVSTLMEMYIQGVSTRKVSAVTESLCGVEFSKSTVSRLCRQLDTQLDTWRNSVLSEPYSCLIVDARYERVREGGSVISKAFFVVIGIRMDGRREILYTETCSGENTGNWETCFRSLKKRGLRGVKYVVSDDHEGLKEAVRRTFPGVVWQRCQVHYLANFSHKLPKKQRTSKMSKMKEVFAATTRKNAKRLVMELIEECDRDCPDVAIWLEETWEEPLAVLSLPPSHRKRLKSTNMLERLNQELKRRSRVIRIFPNTRSVTRVLGSICQSYSERWISGVRYLEPEFEIIKEEEEIIAA